MLYRLERDGDRCLIKAIEGNVLLATVTEEALAEGIASALVGALNNQTDEIEKIKRENSGGVSND